MSGNCWCGCSISPLNYLCRDGHAVYDDNDELHSTQHASGMPAKRPPPLPQQADLIGGEGWKKGVIDCIDVLYARQVNGGGDFGKAIEHLQALFKRDAK